MNIISQFRLKKYQEKNKKKTLTNPYLFQRNILYNQVINIIKFIYKKFYIVTLSHLKQIFLSNRFDYVHNGFYFRFWSNPFKPIFVYQISPHSILIEKQPFPVTLKIALKYFKIKKKENLVWKKVYYHKPSKETEKNIDAFKFFYHQDNNKILKYFIDQSENKNYLNYSLKKDRSGVYFQLIQDLGSHSLTYQLVKRKMESLKINPDQLLIKKIIKEKRNWIKIQSRQENEKNDSKIFLNVSEDKIKVFASKTLPIEIGRDIDELDIRNSLKEKRIVFGTTEKNIQSFLKEPVYNKPFLIADAEAVNKNYKNFFEESYLLSSNKAVGKQNEHFFFFVEKNKIILKNKDNRNKRYRKLNVFGEPYGESFMITDLLINGENTYFDKEGNLRSNVSGTLEHIDNIFNIYKLVHYKQIGLKTGDVKLKGSLLVEGDIDDGVKVQVDGSLIVKGNVGAAVLEVGGNIVVEGGINGAYKADIISRNGSISAKFIRNSSIHCKNDLMIDSFLNDCNTWVGGSVIIHGVKGNIMGGEFYIHKKLQTYNAGSVAGWKTIIHLGIPIEIIYEIDECKKKIEELNQDYMKKNLEYQNSLRYLKSERAIIKEERDQIKQFIQQLQSKLDSLEKEKLKIFPDAELTAKGNIYPGVILYIGNMKWENKYTRNFISLYSKGLESNILMRRL